MVGRGGGEGSGGVLGGGVDCLSDGCVVGVCGAGWVRMGGVFRRLRGGSVALLVLALWVRVQSWGGFNGILLVRHFRKD